MERAIDLAEAADFAVKVVLFQDVKDAAEAVQKNPDILKTAIAAARPAMQFYFEKYLPKPGDLDYSRREELRALRLVYSKLKGVARHVARSFWLGERLQRAGVAKRILTEEMERIEIRADASRKIDTKEESTNSTPYLKKYSRRELIGEQLLGLAVARNN